MPPQVLAVHVPASAVAALVQRALSLGWGSLHVTITDPAGQPLLGFGDPGTMLGQAGTSVRLPILPGVTLPDWRLTITPLSVAPTWREWPRMTLAAVALLLLATMLLLTRYWLRRHMHLGWLLLVLAIALLPAAVLGWRAHQRQSSLAEDLTSAGREVIGLLRTQQQSTLAFARAIHFVAGQLAARQLAGDQAALDAGLVEARRFPNWGEGGRAVAAIAPDGTVLFAAGNMSQDVFDPARRYLRALIDGSGTLAFSMPSHLANGTTVIRSAIAHRNAAGTLQSISISALPVSTLVGPMAVMQKLTKALEVATPAAQDAMMLVRPDGVVVARSDARPGVETLPPAIVRVLAAAAGAFVALQPGTTGWPADRILLAQQTAPEGLFSVLSIDLGARQAALADRYDWRLAASCLFGVLVLLLTWNRVEARAERRRGALVLQHQRAAEQQLAFLETLTSSLDQSVFLLDQYGVVRFANDFANRHFRAKHTPFVGQTLSAALRGHPMSADNMARFQRALDGEKLAPWRTHFVDATGRVFDLDVHVVRVPVEVEAQVGGSLILTMLDVTDLAALEVQAQALARSKFLNDIAVGFSHEINQPLTVAMMGLESIQRRLEQLLPAEQRVQVKLARVVSQVTRAGQMTEALRNLEADGPVDPQPLDVEDLLAQAAADIVEAAQMARVEIRVAVTSNLPPVLAVEPVLRQVLTRLIAAALTAFDGGDPTPTNAHRLRQITLAAHVEGDDVVIAVADTAGPIPEAMLPEVFVPYARIRTGAPSGTLDLAQCVQAMRLLGGTLQADNLTDGLSMTLRLPAGIARPHETVSV